ncbi:GGDEF domain-containing protein [Ningiella sp. W23]|uniref:GGDEF domain-containing protein n=1 Tax=Ningiella sp. W23 TaxID=3023715 RepID=UPI003756C533
MLIISGGICLGILPFAVYRVTTGDHEIALLNWIIVLGTAFIFLHLWLTNNNKIARVGISLLTIFAMTTTIYLKGAANVHWVYPALTATFFLLSPIRAAYMTSVFLLVILAMIYREVSFLFLLTFAVSAGATFLFSFAFSRRMGNQAKFLEQLATTDALTGIGNRRKLEEKLLDIIRRIKRYPNNACSLIIFDIDYFKQVNDKYGHASGDMVLQGFARLIEERIREADSLFRLGGEEFVLVLENTHLFEAKSLAKKIAREVEEARWDIGDLTITTSAGIAEYSEDESTYDWMKRADDALYRAKAAGRNRCISTNDLLAVNA